MFGLFRSTNHQHFIDRGRVACPVRGRDVDIDLCAGCSSLEQIDMASERPFVRCRPEVAHVSLRGQFR